MSSPNNVGISKEQRKFNPAWTDEFPFIQEVTQDSRKCLCTICNKELVVVNKAILKNHIESQRHQMMQNNQIQRNKKKAPYKRFLEIWLGDIRFKSWLQKVPTDGYKFCCTLCNVERSCISGVSNLIRHAKTPEHIAKCMEKDIQTIDEIPPEVVNDSIESFKNLKRAREIEFAKLGCAANISYRAMPKILKFFQDTDPIVLQHMTASATKVSNIVRNILGPSEELQLIELLRKTKFSLYVDETTDPKGLSKWVTFLVSFVDSETHNVMTGILKLINYNSTNLNSESIFNIFQSYMNENEIPFSNILAVACDDVVVRNKHSFQTLIVKENSSIIVIPCICHKVALAAKGAYNKCIPSYIDELLKLIYNHMKNTKHSDVKAFEQFTASYQETHVKILRYATTRWLGHHKCIKKIRELYPSLLAYFTELCLTKQSNKTFQEIKDNLENPETIAYLAFLDYILFEFNKINLFFLHSETRVQLLHSKSLAFLKLIALHFIKSPLVRRLGIEKIDFFSPSNHKSVDEINFGPDCNDILDELSENIDENEELILEIRQNCLKFFMEAANEISESLYYITDDFFSNLSVFSETRALMDSDRDISFEEICYYVKQFGGFNKAMLKAEWRLIHRDFYLRPEIDMCTFDEMWKIVLSNKYPNGEEKYPQLIKLIGYIRSLPHSNVAANITRYFEKDAKSVVDQQHNLYSHTIESTEINNCLNGFDFG